MARLVARLGCAVLVAAALALHPSPAAAQEAQGSSHADALLREGDEHFRKGYYFKASEAYRVALLEDPTSPWKKLAFGHALFAVGNYSYADYALRRGVAELDPSQPFEVDVAGLFPSRRKFVQALRDVKRYVTYSPRDPAGLAVLGYVLYSVTGEERRCRDVFGYLLRHTPDDPFAQFFLDQLRRRTREVTRPAIPEAEAIPADEPAGEPAPAATEPEPAPAPPAPAEPTPPPAPPAPAEPTPSRPMDEVVPAPERQPEELEQAWPRPTPAPAK